MEPVLIVVILAIFVIGIVGAIFGRRARQQRITELADWSESQGWAFDPEHHETAVNTLSRFSPFQVGSRHSAYNSMWGNFESGGIGCTAQAGDYRYRVSSGTGKNRRTTTHRLSYLMLRLPFRELPDVRLRPEGLFDKLSAAFGFDDIDFESAEFSKKWHVSSSDKRFAYDLFHARMIEFMMKGEPPRIEIVDGYACFTTGKTLWSIASFERNIEFAREFIALWPEHLIETLES